FTPPLIPRKIHRPSPKTNHPSRPNPPNPLLPYPEPRTSPSRPLRILRARPRHSPRSNATPEAHPPLTTTARPRCSPTQARRPRRGRSATRPPLPRAASRW
uniref:Uncharacterized protein n=1 Tax=Aegilops tauschii subsp. strangulata TaxID=200361 RepID=A0A453PJI9_AEGTS